jgi:hypothetical protein
MGIVALEPFLVNMAHGMEMPKQAIEPQSNAVHETNWHTSRVDAST